MSDDGSLSALKGDGDIYLANKDLDSIARAARVKYESVGSGWTQRGVPEEVMGKMAVYEISTQSQLIKTIRDLDKQNLSLQRRVYILTFVNALAATLALAIALFKH